MRRGGLGFLLAILLGTAVYIAATPGLPFIEDFTDTTVRDDAGTSADWSTAEQALFLAQRSKQFGPFGPGLVGSNIAANSGANTHSVVLGDVDGDGDLDMVAGRTSAPNHVYLNNGSADPWNGVSGVDITADNHSTYAVALGDVDGDGDLDLIAGNILQPNRLYLNNGTSDPWNSVTGSDITTDAQQSISVALGDVDGDGDLDLVAGNTGQLNRLYLNNGTADPWNGVTGVEITTDADSTWEVALGDVDGDGDLDLVAGNRGTANRLYINNGTSDPWNGVTGADITGDVALTRSVALGDVDGDGDLDLVAGSESGHLNRLYLNNGTSDPWNGVSGIDITTDDTNVQSVALGDLDGDGDLDFVTGNYFQANRLYLNNGTADPWNGVSGTDITSDSTGTASIALGDVDRDGDLDLTTGNENNRARLYLNDGTTNPWAGASGSDITADLNQTFSVALGDVDGDGDLDLVEGNANEAINRLFLNNGTDDPWNGIAGIDISMEVDFTWAVALGDVDRDGHLDLVTGRGGETNRLYLNNGTPDPWNGVTGSDISSDTNSTFSVALGDVDGDGDLDLVAGNTGEINRLYLNNGTATPFSGVTGVDITTDAYETYSVVLGDVDRDGDLDLVAGGNLANRLYLNNGTPDPFNGVTGSDITVDTGFTVSVALGDVDRDGDLDLVAGGYGETSRLYLNNGTPDPWNGVTGSDISSDTDATRAVALADVDRDGDLDFITGNDTNQVNRLYLNDGTANPWNGVAGVDLTTDADFTTSLVLGDVNGDGDLDLVSGNESQVNRLYLNGGNSGPDWDGAIGEDITADAYPTQGTALGDVDGDGDLDLVAGNYTQPNRLYLNNGTSDPWNGVTGSDISSDTNSTYSVALGDVDGDGDLDLVAGNTGEINRLYLNNGTSNPWNGVTGLNITADSHITISLALGDVDGDGDLDLVAGNYNNPSRLYLNNGSSNPWNGVAGVDITSDLQQPNEVALGDVDGDGDLDLVAGNNDQPSRLYLNDGVGDPWDTLITGTAIPTDTNKTEALKLADVDGDGDLDLLVGKVGLANRLYLNNGTADPWDGVVGTDISTDIGQTRDLALGDVDGDGDLDLMAMNTDGISGVNRLYLNNGTSDPWNGVSGIDFSPSNDFSANLGDVDGDGDLDLVTGGLGDPNRFYRGTSFSYHTARGRATSLRVDTEVDPITNAMLTPLATLPPNTAVDYWLSNDGGARWYLVQPAVPFAFPGAGGFDLRWRAELRSLSPVLTPQIDQVQISTQVLPSSIGDRVWDDLDADGIQDAGEPGIMSVEVILYDDVGAMLASTFTDASGNYSFDSLTWGNMYSLGFVPPPGYVLTQLDQGADDGLDSDADPATGDTPLFTLGGFDSHTRWDAGVILASIGDRVWEDLDGDGIQDAGEPGVVSAQVFLYDGGGTWLDATFTDTNGNYSFDNLAGGNTYSLRIFPPPGYVFSPIDQGADDSLDSDVDPATGNTPVFTIGVGANYSLWDAGVVPSIPCTPPDEPIYLYLMTLSTDGNDYPILHFMDANQPTQISGYNIYRSFDPGLLTDPASLFATDIIDMDEATPNKQWVDISGDVAPGGIWYYGVTAWNNRCPAGTAEGPF